MESQAFVTELRNLLRARTPIVHLRAVDHGRALDLIRKASDPRALHVWTCNRGLLADSDGRAGADPATARLSDALARVSATAASEAAVFVLVDPGAALLEPDAVRTIRDLSAWLAGHTHSSLLILEDEALPPGSLDRYVVTFGVPAVSLFERVEQLEEMMRALRTSRHELPSLSAGDRIALARASAGLTVLELENLVARAIIARSEISADDAGHFIAARARRLDRSRLMRASAPDVGPGDVGGADVVRAWVADAVAQLHDAGARAVRGVLLAGAPGAGRGHLVRMLAGTLQVPLVRLDGADLLDSEPRRVARALVRIERFAPAVAWIDGLDVVAAATGERARRNARIVGRWIRGQRVGAIVAATATDGEALTPDWLRPAAFDRVFLVDLPGPKDRTAILRVLFRAARAPAGAEAITALAEATAGWVPEELAFLVRELARNHASEDADSWRAIARARVPLSTERHAQLAALRTWAARRAERASSEPAETT